MKFLGVSWLDHQKSGRDQMVKGHKALLLLLLVHYEILNLYNKRYWTLQEVWVLITCFIEKLVLRNLISDITYKTGKMGEHKKESGRDSSFFRSLASFFCISGGGDERSKKHAPPTSPEAAMVAAAKHFSSVHKVRLI